MQGRVKVDMEVGYPIAAAITAVPATLAWINARRTRHNVGPKNGLGPVTEMLELVIENQQSHAELDRLQFQGILARLDLVEHKVDKANGTSDRTN